MTRSAAAEPWWLRGNIAAGQFFFRYRNTLFPLLFGLAALCLRPRVILDRPGLDRGLVIAGMGVAVSGELVRLVTIGYEYIERGGKQGRVYASRLVQGGVYGLTRNPMYVGNGLIAIGVSMVTGAPAAYLVLIPLFLFIYQAIVAAEEAYLHRQFGAEYAAYCARVPRFLPSFRGAGHAFAGMRYHWRRSVRQDLSTITALAMALVLLPFWRRLCLDGWVAARPAWARTATLALAVLAGYGILHRLKKLGRLA
ncbi:MAG: isoprenylcysteine carboxylmethyltransferase family protein [Candidatus Omnitrophica bacterium]|nr:isoprenylcysteine carboxylmethyltransferase family protein [Candidatus Omnitrophota bacterium]